MQEMMLHLVTNSTGMAAAWNVAFKGYEGITIHRADLREFIVKSTLSCHPQIRTA